MKCDDIKQLLNSYIDNELSVEDTDRVKKHLQECIHCTKEVAELNKVSKMINSLPRLNAPLALTETISQQISGSQQLADNLFWRYRWAIGSLVSAAAVFMLVYITVNTSYHPEKYTIKEPSVITKSAPKEELVDSGVQTEKKVVESKEVSPKPALIPVTAPSVVSFSQNVQIRTDNIDKTINEVYKITASQSPFKQSGRGVSRQYIVKVTVPLSQKDAFIHNLKSNISDQITFSEMRTVEVLTADISEKQITTTPAPQGEGRPPEQEGASLKDSVSMRSRGEPTDKLQKPLPAATGLIRPPSPEKPKEETKSNELSRKDLAGKSADADKEDEKDKKESLVEEKKQLKVAEKPKEPEKSSSEKSPQTKSGTTVLKEKNVDIMIEFVIIIEEKDKE